MTLTYLGVHPVFVLPVLALLLWRRPTLPVERRRTARIGLLLMGTVAFAYTMPWDRRDRARAPDDGAGRAPGTALGTDDGADAAATDDDPTPIAD